MKKKTAVSFLCLLLCCSTLLSLCCCAAGSRTGSAVPSVPQTVSSRVSSPALQASSASSSASSVQVSSADASSALDDGMTPCSEQMTALTEVNVRAQPNAQSEKLGVLTQGQTVTRVASDGQWSKILYGQGEAYVFSVYLAAQAASSAASAGKDAAESAPQAAGTGIYYAGTKPLVAINAGHQHPGNSQQEPIGPGAAQTKDKVSAGAQGISTGLAEYELNLQVALQLRDELLSRGYSVLMIRESSDVDISNAQRAQLANSYGAACVISIHANSSTDSGVTGAMGVCQSDSNPYTPGIYNRCFALTQYVLQGYCSAVGMNAAGTWCTDTMTTLNWSTVPSMILEMGYQSNADDDRRMAQPQFWQQAAKGIADGIDEFFAS